MGIVGSVAYVAVELGDNHRRTLGVCEKPERALGMLEEVIGKSLEISTLGIVTDPDREPGEDLVGVIKSFIVK